MRRKYSAVRSGVERLLWGLAILLMARPCEAQWVGTPWSPRSPFITDRELDEVIPSLGLTEDQRAVFLALIDDHRKRVNSLAEEWEEVASKRFDLAKRHDGPPPNSERHARLMRRGLGIAEEVQRARRSLESSISAMLEPEQRAVWEDFILDRRRLRSLRTNTSFAAEQVPLVRIVTDLHDDDPIEQWTEVDQILNEYKRRLDVLLIERNNLTYEKYRSFYEDIIARHEGTYEDPLQLNAGDLDGLSGEEVMEVGERLRRLGVERAIAREQPHKAVSEKVAQLKRATLERIASLLGPGPAERLREEFRRYAYPGLFDLPRAGVVRFNGHAFIERVRRLDLSEQQRTVIESIARSYDVRFKAIAIQLVGLRDEEEKNWKEEMRGTLDPSIEQERSERLAQRKELQRTTIRTIRLQLTEEQRHAIGFSADDRGW